MNIKIQKVDLSITNNGTVKAIVFPEGADITNQAEGFEVLGEENVIFLATRKTGENITFIEKGKWLNVAIPDDYLTALNSPTYERIKLMFKRAVAGLNKIANGNRSQIDLDTANLLLVNNLEIHLKMQEFVLETLKNTGTEFAQQVVQDIKSKDSNTSYNAWKIVNDLTQRNLADISKDYSIINNGEPPKEKTQKQH